MLDHYRGFANFKYNHFRLKINIPGSSVTAQSEKFVDKIFFDDIVTASQFGY